MTMKMRCSKKAVNFNFSNNPQQKLFGGGAETLDNIKKYFRPPLTKCAKVRLTIFRIKLLYYSGIFYQCKL